MPSVYLSTTDRGVYYLPSPPLSRDTNLVPGYLSKIWAPFSRGHVRLSFDADSFLLCCRLCCCLCCLFIAFFFWTSHQTNNFTIRFYVIGAFRTEKISIGYRKSSPCWLSGARLLNKRFVCYNFLSVFSFWLPSNNANQKEKCSSVK